VDPRPVAKDTADVVKHPAKAAPKAAAPTERAADDVAYPTTPPASPAATDSRGSLPYTGAPAIDRLMLGGALLVLFGMLTQIAGQPLPAPARARVRA
jgi:hypothetical protein